MVSLLSRPAIHVATELARDDGTRETLLLDTHSRPIRPEVLDRYAHVLERTGPVSTLLEWDHDIPDIERMAHEVATIRAVVQRVTGVATGAREATP